MHTVVLQHMAAPCDTLQLVAHLLKTVQLVLNLLVIVQGALVVSLPNIITCQFVQLCSIFNVFLVCRYRVQLTQQLLLRYLLGCRFFEPILKQ